MPSNALNLNLYVVDDDEAVRRSYGALLLARGHTVRLFDSGEAFLNSVDLGREGCVLLDLRMDGMSGLAVFDELRRRASPLVVLFLSGHGDIATAVEAVQGGAFGWLEKPCDEARLMREIEKALQQAASQADRRRTVRHGLGLWASLTEREREVATLVAEGKSSKMIARILGQRHADAPVNHRTVETHRGRVFDKLCVANSNELLIFLQDHGLYATPIVGERGLDGVDGRPLGNQAVIKPKTERRLAAVLAADVVGYTRLMGRDEAGTHARLKAIRREVVDPSVKKHGGRVVKSTGDGVLVEFPSAVEAAASAVEVQRALLERNAGVPDDEQMVFRMGLNIGDLIIDEGDIFGDGVNVAVRLETLCVPGGICISRAARDQIRDKVPYVFDDLGEQQVKNVARPVRAFQIRLDGLDNV